MQGRMSLDAPAPTGENADNRFAFLVSTTACARDLQRHVGDADYSYAFVLKQLQPVLEQLGTVRRIDRPESSLCYAAREARRQGLRPVHIALNPPHNAYFTPEVPTILFPFWEFPDVPNRPFLHDGRQNWTRVCRSAEMLITAATRSTESFVQAGVTCPTASIPVPLDPRFFEVPAWDPRHETVFNCRHLVIQGTVDGTFDPYNPLAASDNAADETDSEEVDSDETPDTIPLPTAVAAPVVAASQPRDRWREWGLRGYRVLRKVIGAGRAEKILARYHESCQRYPQRRHMPQRALHVASRLGYSTCRHVYHTWICRWLSPEAVHRLGGIKRRVVSHQPQLPLLPAHPLKLSGLVYTSIFNLSDRRKNSEDLLSGFLLAFKDRADVTLVLKLATNPQREYHEVQALLHVYGCLGIRHRCRLVVITDFLSDEQMAELNRATTYYLNTSRAEGACLPLQEAMASGRPVLAPRHTAMADYIDSRVGLVLESHPEPTFWPHDPQRRYETTWNRLVWADLYEKLQASAELVAKERSLYDEMATAARKRMLSFASRPVVAEQYRQALRQLPADRAGISWAA